MAKDKHYSYYFAYGTPVIDRGLERRVDTLRLEGWGKLKAYEFNFSRAGNQPNIKENDQAETWGLMFLVEEKDFNAVDGLEPGGARTQGKVLMNGIEEDCFFYVHPAEGDGHPDADFLTGLREGYRIASLPQRQLDKPLGVTTVAR